MSKSSKANSTLKKLSRRLRSIALVLLLLFGVAPVVLAAFDSSSNESFSIYNEDYDGLSFVRENLEGVETNTGQSKYSVTNIVSNLNILNRFNGSGALVIAGPSSDFGVTETISIVLYMLRGGSVIIADDFGSGNQVLAPIFSAFQNIDKFAEQAQEQGFEVPDVTEIFGGGEDDSGDSGDGGIGSQLPGDPGSFGGSSADIGESDFITEMIGDLIVEFGFNSSGILMDVNSNIDSPVRPIITDFYPTNTPGYTFTQNLEKVAMEFASIISVKLRIDAKDADGNPIDADGDGETDKREVWQPLQKLSGALISEDFGDDSFSVPLPFFPMYSSRFSWIETDFESAAAGEMVPDESEWGNANFATALSIPMFPGFGKLVFLSDPSIFINRYTQQNDIYDNMQLVLNLMEMATYDQEPGEDGTIPILFDFGHTYQSLTSPALYSTALLKLIAEISMFPLYAPFVPFFAYGYGKRLIPSSRRLRPILLTKRRGERGHSDFERRLELIKETGTYGEPIMYLSRRLVRKVNKAPMFEGSNAKNPKEMAKFFKANYSTHVTSERELRSQISSIFRIAENPTRRMSKVAAKNYLNLLVKLDSLL